MSNPPLHRVTIHLEICHGKPNRCNIRYPVDLILDLLSAGISHKEILNDYPSLEEDIRACLAYAAKLTKIESYAKFTT